MEFRLPVQELIAFSLMLSTSYAADGEKMFKVQIGAFPWHDRVNQWALDEVPGKYLSEAPIPQQSCGSRSLVLPVAGLKAVTLAVPEAQLKTFLDQHAMTDTGDRLKIRQGKTRLLYAIVNYATPAKESLFKFSRAGVILLSLAGSATAAVAKPKPDPSKAVDEPGKGQYIVDERAFPWHDRMGRWLMVNVPDAVKGGGPIPRMSCSTRALETPSGVKSVTMGLVKEDLPRARGRYPGLRDTGLTFGIQNPKGGATLTYAVVVFPNPPAEAPFGDLSNAGVIMLRLDGNMGAAPPKSGIPLENSSQGVLQQDQEFAAQEWPFEPGPRQVKMWVEEPAKGIAANTGFMLVLHNWGGVYDAARYKVWCRTFADRYNVVAMSVNYLQSGPAWQRTRDRFPYDHGYLQAMDAIGALYTVRRQLRDKGVAFNEGRIYVMGGSGGGNVTQMAMKLAPRTFACGVDICGMPGLPDGIAYGTRAFGSSLNAGYSRDPQSPNYLSSDGQEIRDFALLEHCRLRARVNPDLKVIIVHGLDDTSCPVVPKIGQFQRMVQAGLKVDGHFLTPADIDQVAVKSTGHSVGDRMQVVFKYADVYLKEDGKLARATTDPNDFARGDTFIYPTTNGQFVIDFSDYPKIKFQKKP